jgi:hypothetical protein
MTHETIENRGIVLGWNPFMKWGVVQIDDEATQVVVQASDLDPEAGITDLSQGSAVDIEYRYERSGAYEYRAVRVRPLAVNADEADANARAKNS